jgi:hypothetical protein
MKTYDDTTNPPRPGRGGLEGASRCCDGNTAVGGSGTEKLRASSPRRKGKTRPKRQGVVPGADQLLEDALNALISIQMRVRYGDDLNIVGKIILRNALIDALKKRHGGMVVIEALQEAIRDVGRRLAARLSYAELHAVAERVAGNPNSLEWGRRFSAVCHAFNGCRTSDGNIWLT